MAPTTAPASIPSNAPTPVAWPASKPKNAPKAAVIGRVKPIKFGATAWPLSAVVVMALAPQLYVIDANNSVISPVQ